MVASSVTFKRGIAEGCILSARGWGYSITGDRRFVRHSMQFCGVTGERRGCGGWRGGGGGGDGGGGDGGKWRGIVEGGS